MKVLIFAYDFPPLVSVGGQRPYSWYKYLPQHGIQATVVTRYWSDKMTSPADYAAETLQQTTIEHAPIGNAIIRAPFKPNLRDRILTSFGYNRFVLLRKFLTFIYSYLEHLFFAFDSKAAIYYEAEKAIEKDKPDFIIVTAEPFILFKYGHSLSAKFNIPWIADYRDGWTTNQGDYSLGILQNMQSRFYRGREEKYVANSRLITTAAPGYAESLAQIHPGKEIKTIYNGFDEEYFRDIENILLPIEKFTIAYAGTIYPHQNLEMFLDGLKIFIENQKLTYKQLGAYFYGMESQTNAKERLLNYNSQLLEYLVCKPRLPYAELVKKMRASHVLLLLSRKGANWLNAKVFDYLGVKREIMLVENDQGILEKILRETNGGVALNSSASVSEFLETEYKKFKSGQAQDSGVNAEYLKYTRENQAAGLAKILKTIG